MAIRATSFSEVSLMAMVPDSECRMPTLIGPVSALGASPAAGRRRGGGAVAAGASFFSQAANRAKAPSAQCCPPTYDCRPI